jgi:hypothetical protein
VALVDIGVAGVIQLVECQLPKLDVAGSSPVARSLKGIANSVVIRAEAPAASGAFALGAAVLVFWALTRAANSAHATLALNLTVPFRRSSDH